MPPDALDISGLTVRHGDVLAVDGLDLRIGRGETVALLGPDGAGKSSTHRCPRSPRWSGPPRCSAGWPCSWPGVVR